MLFAGIALYTNNVQSLSTFYQKVLETTSDGDSPEHQEIATEGAFLAIMKADGDIPSGPAPLALAFTVSDVDAEFERLQSLGVAILEPPTLRPWGAKNMTFFDPDGNLVAFRYFPGKTE